MKKILSLLLFCSPQLWANETIVFIEKDQPAPFQGYLFTPEEQDSMQKELLEKDQLEDRVKYLEESSILSKVFSRMELDLLNPSEVYEVELDGKTYYHIQDLEDGDFIATDKEKRVYSITHDPFEVTLLSEDLLGYLKSI